MLTTRSQKHIHTRYGCPGNINKYYQSANSGVDR